jgi:hypothetical protein
MIAYFSRAEPYDADAELVRCIQGKLQGFNRQEGEENKNSPSFVWTCHKDCLWIAMKVYRFDTI